MEITKKLREYMKKVDIDKLFNEIDFFGNGYVDSASLSEFICHYNKNGYEQIEKECLHIIKVLKDSASATRLFF